ncbi:hypothetical protein [Tropicimonas aquimaris]|uniref:Uncharacterized protein n=1 Tax=Tropicimonas aquimaris TaxID=914152 RepID=A0ABW3ILK0_9RHOB
MAGEEKPDRACDNRDSATQAGKTRKVRGLLDIVVAEAEGVEWQFDLASDDPLSGIGLGLWASPRARELVVKGLLFERWLQLEEEIKRLKRPAGRPKAFDGPLSNIDAQRAFALWEFAHRLGAGIKKRPFDPSIGVGITTRALIGLAKIVEADLSPDIKPLFPSMTSDATLEQSVSRGRAALGIDERWRSKTCEKLAEI